MNDWMGLLISVVYIFGLIGLAEGLRRWRGFSSDFTRKAIHIGVGMLAWALPFLFSEPWLFILACLGFMVLNLLDWRFGFFAAMSSSSRSNLGTVYFPLAAAVVAYVFWDSPPIMVAALMPLTWGDGLAPVIGKLYGRHRYHIHTSVRTVEGSIGFFLAAVLATWLALWVMPGAVLARGHELGETVHRGPYHVQRIVGTEALGQDVLRAGAFQHGADRATGYHAGPRTRRFE